MFEDMSRKGASNLLVHWSKSSELKDLITIYCFQLEKQRQFEASKVNTMRLMLDKEQKYIRDLRSEYYKKITKIRS